MGLTDDYKEKMIKELETKAENLDKLVKGLEAKKGNYEKDIKDLADKKAVLEQKISELEKHLKNEVENAVSDANDRIAKKENELNDKLASTDKEHARLGAETVDAETRQKEFIRARENAEAVIKDYEAKIKDVEVIKAKFKNMVEYIKNNL